MQNTRTSKSLDAIIASAIFTATKLKATSHFEDILLLELISHRDTLCYQLLSNRLNAAQIDQLETIIRRRVSTTHLPTELSLGSVTPEIFYRDLVEAIATRYPEANRISTIHALHFILSSAETIASRMLAMMGLNSNTLNRDIAQYSAENDITPLLAIDRPASSATKTAPHPLAKFGIDLTEAARRGEIDPVIGRESETERVIEILSRRKKNNPILIGHAGVGKSAIVEGLAIRIANNDVPSSIANKHLFSIDISALVAGTKFRGEFEERIQQLLSALKESRDAIIFIDEIHTIVGAGSTQGSLDTANILKPALARGDIQTIGATTLDEYRTHIEADAALDRRFNKVVVKPTTIEQSVEILRRIAPTYEDHHSVIYTEGAIEACVRLCDRYINDRQLPDKAIDVMDEAGARLSLQPKSPHAPRRPITSHDIECVVASVTGIPVARLSGDELARLRTLSADLDSRVIGQSHAVEKLSRTIQRSRTGLNDEHRPIGVFIFLGPTGVGKTLLAKELSKWMFGDKSQNLIRIDMSEYSEGHTISRLIGSPAGYVGYGDGGVLSEAVRRNPYSVILLDEIEKAHSDIFNVMLQVFDEGRLTDGAGRKIDLRNTIIIMTSNVGAHANKKAHTPIGYKTTATKPTSEMHYMGALEGRFSPEFINRIDEVILFRTLELHDIERITQLELDKIAERAKRLGYNIRVTPAARRELATKGYQSKYGARALRRTLLEHIEEPLSELIVNGKIERGDNIVIERNRRSDGVRIKVA